MTYPTTSPELTLDFAKSEQLDPRVTFSRSSSATYVGYDGLIKTAPADVARFEYDANGKCLGLLIEEARTNNFQYSTELDNAYYDLATGLTKTPNNAVSPDGNSTALLITEDTSTGEHVFGKTANVPVTNNCMSIFVKPNGKTRVGFVQGSETIANVVFDLTGSGSVVSGTGFIEKYANGWYRVTQVRSGTGNKTYFHLLNNADDALSYTGDGTSGCWIWGYQKEAGTFPTSIIPTAGSTVTRAADVASITGTNFSSWYNQGEGTVLLKSTAIKKPSGNSFFFGISDGTVNNRISIYGPFPDTARGIVVSSGTSIGLSSAIETGSIFKSAIAVKTGDYGFVHDEMPSPVTSASTQVPPVVTTLALGVPYGTGNPDHSFIISRLTYYPERVSDESLEALTA